MEETIVRKEKSNQRAGIEFMLGKAVVDSELGMFIEKYRGAVS